MDKILLKHGAKLSALLASRLYTMPGAVAKKQKGERVMLKSCDSLSDCASSYLEL